MTHEKNGLDELRLWFIVRKASFAQAGYKADLVECSYSASVSGVK
jgi:hypothetical protein